MSLFLHIYSYLYISNSLYISFLCDLLACLIFCGGCPIPEHSLRDLYDMSLIF